MKNGYEKELLCLQKSFLFAGLPDSFLLQFLQTDGWQVKKFPKGTEIPGNHFLMLVLQGKVLAYQGAEQTILRLFQKWDCLGAASLYAEQSFGLLRIVAASHCEILFIPAETVTDLRRTHWQINENYIAFLCERVAFLNQKISGFTAGSAQNKLLLYARNLREQKQDKLTDNVSRLAQSLDVSRASLYRAIHALEKQGILYQKEKDIYIKEGDF